MQSICQRGFNPWQLPVFSDYRRGLLLYKFIFLLLAEIVAFVQAPKVFAQADARSLLSSRDWQGFQALATLARQQGLRLVPAEANPGQALIVISPAIVPSVSGIREFVSEGGRVAILDDSSQTRQLVAEFGMKRVSPPKQTLVLQQHPSWLLAKPFSEVHPLARDVEVLLCHQPQAIWHPTLDPVFSFGNKREGLVVTGAVGKGRLIVISDASVLQNGMLGFQGNRDFALNLLHYLDQGRNRTIGLLTGYDNVYWKGSTRIGGSQKHHFQRLLTQASHAHLSDPVIQLIVLCWIIIAFIAIAAKVHFSGASQRPYDAHLSRRQQLSIADLVVEIESQARTYVQRTQHAQPSSRTDERANQSKFHQLMSFKRSLRALRRRKMAALPAVVRKRQVRKFAQQSEKLLKALMSYQKEQR